MPERPHWVDVWACMPQLTELDNLPPPPYTEDANVFQNTTIRQTIRVNLESHVLQLRLSNKFGSTPLTLSSVTIALSPSSGSSSVAPESRRSLTFSGNESITVPPSCVGISDNVHLSIHPGDIVSISIFLRGGQGVQDITGHPGSRTTSWLAKGNQTNAPDLVDGAPLDHWYYISSLLGQSPGVSFCIIGDSITDGRGSTHNMNDRWTDHLWRRMLTDPRLRSISPVNLGAGGNRVLAHGLGPCAWSRIGRDALSHPNTRYIMLFEGVNDIGTADATEEAQERVLLQLITAYTQIINLVHSFGLPIFGATITPFSGSPITQPYSHVLRERTRQSVNRWIAEESGYDYVFDFATALCDPLHPDRLYEEYDSGDHLHLSSAGMLRLANSFDLRVFDKFK